MKRTKAKIVLLICITFLIAFSVILISFNFLLNNYIKKGAREAIDQYFENSLVGSWEYRFSPYFASGLYLEKTADNRYLSDQFSDEPQLPYKSNLIKWLSEHDVESGKIVKAQIEDRTYYLSLQPIQDDPRYLLAVYVDITAEKHLVFSISLAILIVMFLCSIGACAAGIYMGKKIEQEQWQQKKVFEDASHQLKTPLMVIQGYAEGLAYGVIKNERQTAEIIMDETEKMAALIDEILNLSRIESNDIVFAFEPVSLQKLLHNCLPAIEMLAEKKQIRIEVELEDSVVKADSVQLERALINVLANALRYAETTIRISGDSKSLMIWNDGEGVPADELNSIFERFHIGKSGQTGIGLSFTQEVIKRHGWEILAENTDGGTRFVIKLKK